MTASGLALNLESGGTTGVVVQGYRAKLGPSARERGGELAARS